MAKKTCREIRAIACHKQLLLFSTMFSKAVYCKSVKCHMCTLVIFQSCYIKQSDAGRQGHAYSIGKYINTGKWDLVCYVNITKFKGKFYVLPAAVTRLRSTDLYLRQQLAVDMAENT